MTSLFNSVTPVKITEFASDITELNTKLSYITEFGKMGNSTVGYKHEYKVIQIYFLKKKQNKNNTLYDLH